MNKKLLIILVGSFSLFASEPEGHENPAEEQVEREEAAQLLQN